MHDIILFLNNLITVMPLELFVFVGTSIDEVISPIPAFIVLVPAGIAAHIQSIPWWYLGILSLISGIARTASGYVLYVLANKLERIIFRKNRKFFGYSHKNVKTFGQKLATTSRTQSWWLLLGMHALPIFPGTLLSLGSGFVRLPLSIFTSATLLGSTVAALFYLYLGYSGMETAELLQRLDTTAQLVTVSVILVLGVWLISRYFTKRRVRG